MGNFLQGLSQASYFNDLSSVSFTDDEKEQIEKQIAVNKVMVYSKSYCPYCDMAKKLLETNGIEYEAVEINTVTNSLVVQAILFNLTGQKTVPNIFIGGKHIGGNSEIQQLAKSGTLKTILEESGIKNSLS